MGESNTAAAAAAAATATTTTTTNGGVARIRLAQYRDLWQAVLNTVMKVPVS